MGKRKQCAIKEYQMYLRNRDGAACECEKVKEHSKAKAEKEEWHSKSHFLSTISYIAFIHTEYRLNLFIEVDSEKSKNTDIKEVPHLWVKRACLYFKSSWGAIQKRHTLQLIF